MDLIGIGSPLVDLVLPVDDAFLLAHVPGGKGGMVMVEADFISELVVTARKQLKAETVQAAGGAASNTVVGVAALGLRTAFTGACGTDALAGFYRDALRARGCEPRLIERADLPTGRVLSLVTPDGQRTMRTCLGAAAALDPALMTAERFAGCRMVMLEGYTLFNHALTRSVAAAAKAAGCQLALDLASFEVVQANRAVLDELLSGQVDLVFANEDEAKAWSGGDPESALADLAKRVPLAVVKLGKDGALIAHGGAVHRVAASPVVEVKDTTGAGDTWAAGFLAAYLKGLALPACGQLGALAASACVQVMGAQVPESDWHRLKGWLDAWA
jgi:sugar/nucleoside kinase (ribokinase family)